MAPHDMNDPTTSLADALAALPLAAPEPGVWPKLEASLLQRAAERQFRPAMTAELREGWRRRSSGLSWRAVAAAAALLVAVPLLRLWSTAPVDAPVQPPGATIASAAPADDLIARNRQLQASLEGLGEPLDAGAALAAAELEDLIGMVDVQLSATDDPDHARALWRQRLVLMQELAGIHARGDYRLATNDTPQAGLVPAAYVID